MGFLGALVALLADSAALLTAVLQGSPLVNLILLPLGLAALGGLAFVVLAALSLRDPSSSRLARAHYAAVAVGCLLLFGVAHWYHLTTAPLALLD